MKLNAAEETNIALSTSTLNEQISDGDEIVELRKNALIRRLTSSRIIVRVRHSKMVAEGFVFRNNGYQRIEKKFLLGRLY